MSKERTSTFRAISKCTFVNSDFAIFDFYMIDEGGQSQDQHAFRDTTGNYKRICEGNIIITKNLEANVDYDILYLYNDSIRYLYVEEVDRAVEICKERAKFLFNK